MTPAALKTLCAEAGCVGTLTPPRYVNLTSLTPHAQAQLAACAHVLLGQLEWHEQRAAQLRAIVNLPNAIDFAEVHEVAASRIRTALEAL